MARPVGSTTRPQFYTYTDETHRKEFVKWVKENYKNDPQLAKWYGDQLFGKAPQPVEGGDPTRPLYVVVAAESAERYGISPKPKGSSKR